MKRVKVGIIGCGNISRYGNAPGYLECEKAEITAVCDSLRERARECMSSWGSERFYTDYRKLLRDDGIDAVDICLPNYLHAKVCIEAAEAGKHIAVQKPMAMNVTECDEMIKAATNAGVKLMVEECEIFYPPYMKTKELVEKEQIGDPRLMQISLQSGVLPPEEYEKRRLRVPEEEESRISWRARREKHGGFIFDTVWHKFALAYDFFGPVEKVDAWIENLEKEMPSTIMWKHENRKYGTMSIVHTPKMYAFCEFLRYPLPAVVEVVGSKGIIWATRSEGQTIEAPPVIMYDGVYPGKTIHFETEADYFSGFRNMTRHFVECILEDERPKLTGEDGREILQFALAVYRSAKEERTVNPSSITDWDWKAI